MKIDDIPQSLTFDDVLLRPAYSECLPADTTTKTRIAQNIELNIPIISSAMDTVTGSRLAIAMAQNGGMGCIHRNMGIKDQAKEVRRVKKYESGIVVDPVTIPCSATLADALKTMDEYNISGIPVVDEKNDKLAGILTNRDVRYAKDRKELVSNLMTKDGLVTAKEGISIADAKMLLHKNKIERIIVVDDNYRCTGLITGKDIDKSKQFPLACKDSEGRLRVAAAIGTGKDGLKRAQALVEAGVDVLVIDTAHGHSKSVLELTTQIKKLYPKTALIVGNIATAEGAKALIKAGADTVKVGIGPGSICTTRIVAGVGVPQLSALFEVVEVCKKKNIPVISDGGIRYSGDLAKAIAAGASCIMIGSLFAGTEETPGDIILFKGRSYKAYRGMGSVGAMARGSADRYFQQDITDKLKLVPEGVEGRVPYKGPVADVIHQLIGGLKAAMGYTGHRTIKEMRSGKCKFTRITNSGLKESHAHDITITNESPNYTTES